MNQSFGTWLFIVQFTAFFKILNVKESEEAECLGSLTLWKSTYWCHGGGGESYRWKEKGDIRQFHEA